MKKHVICGLITLVAFSAAVYAWEPADFQFACQDPLMPFVHPDNRITMQEFNEFLNHLSLDQKKLLLISLCKSKSQKQKIEALQSISTDEITREALWMSSHWTTYMFQTFDYHELVKWVAGKLSIPAAEVDYATTFQLEHRICEAMFAKMWDKLSPEEREKVLRESNYDSSNTPGIVAMSGGAAIAALATAEAVSGFAFYIITAKTLAVAAAATFGVSVTTTISAVSALCGPVGWGIAAVSLAGGSLLIGRADLEQSAAFVIQAHYLKITAMKNSNIEPQKYFLR